MWPLEAGGGQSIQAVPSPCSSAEFLLSQKLAPCDHIKCRGAGSPALCRETSSPWARSSEWVLRVAVTSKINNDRRLLAT